MSPASPADHDPELAESASAEGFWALCTAQFMKELPREQFDTWIRPLKIAVADAGTADEPPASLALVAPNRFVQQWIRERFLGRLETLAAQYWGAPVQVSVTQAMPRAAGANPTADAAPPPRALAAASPAPADSRYAKTRLNPDYTFDTFVTGKANQLARAASIQVASNPGTSYNPLFLYGGVGLGKTHLVQAIGNQMVSAAPEARIRYIHAEQYVTDVVRAYQKKAFDEFKRYYHSLDLLIIDDIQFFNNKNRTQEEFFYAFNALIEGHKQVIITCDTYPREIAGIEDRLISRFGWGLTVAIEPPELEMRVAILLKKAESQGIALDDTVAFFIAKHLRSNVRELEGALRKLVAYSKFHARDITLELARDALRDLLRVQNRAISLENIQKTVADFYRVKVPELFSKKRTADLVKPRQIAMYFAKELTSLSLPEIGESFGGRDHTTVLHAVRKITEARKSDSQLNHELHVLDQIIKG
ncbi:MAG: chromosomal replication initiator protein DnaA [Burkholderiales bacterium]|nr:chromosomal replication initiator protein DnaA [Burkholderiales bacterium]